MFDFLKRKKKKGVRREVHVVETDNPLLVIHAMLNALHAVRPEWYIKLEVTNEDCEEVMHIEYDNDDDNKGESKNENDGQAD